MIKVQKYIIVYEVTDSDGEIVRLSATALNKEDRNDLIRMLRKKKNVHGIAWRPIFANGKIEWHDGRRRLY